MEYLSKEEIKQWRSSLERITLEEYAKRLGKAIKGEKQTNDIVDIVLSNSSSRYISDIKDEKSAKDTIIELAKKPDEMEIKKQIQPSIKKALENQETEKTQVSTTQNKSFLDISKNGRSRRLNFNKPLTEREQKVLDYFVQNSDVIVYAKDLAKILNLPTDYVYKYIKNLRAKIAEDVLENAVKGGYKLSI